MKAPKRITIALDDETSDLLENMKKSGMNQSNIIRNAIQCYHENKDVTISNDTVHTYIDLLSSGEHIILDIDHWLLFLKHITSISDKDDYLECCKSIARSHADQLVLKVKNEEDMLKRLEICNFFKITKNGDDEYTLLLRSEVTKDFIKLFLEEFFNAMDFKVKIKEDFSKLRVTTSRLK